MERYPDSLPACPLFAGMDRDEICSALDCISASITKKQAGEYLLRAGDTTELMGLVLSGSVLVIQEDVWGHRNILSYCRAGDCFGETYAAKPGSVLNSSVVAEEECEILFLNVRCILSPCATACDRHQKLIRNFAGMLANKNLVLNSKITHISKRTTREKLLSFLSAESLRQGSLSFNIVYDRQQLADYLCVERAAMSAELSKLQKEGLLKTNRNHFELLPGKAALS